MAPITVLVAAATGAVGTPLTHALLRAGHAVHALTRDPSAPRAVALADAGARLFRIHPDANSIDEAALAAAAAGCTALYLNATPSADPSLELVRAAALLRAARTAGVRTLVLHGTQGADNVRSWPEWAAWLADAGPLGAHWAGKAELEADARTAGFEHVIAVRGALYMTNFVRPEVLALLFPELREEPIGQLRIAVKPDTRVALIDPVDLAHVAALAIARPEEFGDGVNVVGQWLTFSEIAAALGRTLDKRVEAVHLDPAEGRVKGADVRMTYGAVLELLSDRVGFSAAQKLGITFTTFEEFLKREAGHLGALLTPN